MSIQYFVILGLLVSIHVDAAPYSQNIQSAHSANDNLMICYVNNEAGVKGSGAQFLPYELDPTLCDYGIYGFAGIGRDFQLYPTHKAVDLPKSKGGNFDGYHRFGNLRRRHPDFKTLIGIGGFISEFEDRFSEMASKAATRKVFIDSVMTFLECGNFDGVNIDWYDPGLLDKRHYSQLIEELKTAFAGNFTLSVTVSGRVDVLENGYDLGEISSNVEFISIRAYNLHDYTEGYTQHHTAYGPYGKSLPKDKLLNAFDAAHYAALKVSDPRKLILGIPSYGHTYTLQTEDQGIYAEALYGLPGSITNEKGLLSYYEICDQYHNDSGNWSTVIDDGMVSPYATYFKFSNGKYCHQWVAYDNEASIEKKCELINDLDFGGATLWSVDLDDFSGHYCKTSPFSLLRLIREKCFNQPIPTTTTKQPTTTDKLTTTTEALTTTTEASTTTQKPTTTIEVSTTEEATTTQKPITTTGVSTTTEKRSTTKQAATTTTTQEPTTTPEEPTTTQERTTSTEVPKTTTTKNPTTTQEHTTTTDVPTTTTTESPTTQEHTTTTDVLTTTTAEEPTTTQEHTTTTDVPTTTTKEETTTTQEPITTTDVPTTTTTEEPTTTQEPTTTTEEHTTTQQPTTSTEITTTTTTEEPKTTQQSTTTTDIPITTTMKQPTTTQEPTTTTEVPITITTKQSTTTQETTTTTEASITTTTEEIITTQEPTNTTDVTKITTTEKPITTQEPTTTREQTTTAAEESTTTQDPATTTEVPGTTSTEEPTTTPEVTTTKTEEPATQQPTTTTEVPTTTTAPPPPTEGKVVCYAASRAAGRPAEGVFYPWDMDPTLCTHGIYGFAGISHNYTIKSLSPDFDFGPSEGGNNDGYRQFTKLRKQNKNFKALLGVGGYDDVSNGIFSELVKDTLGRQRFISSAITFLKTFKFDGLNIDWYFPGDDPLDKDNFVKFLQTMSAEFAKNHLSLSIAASARTDVLRRGYNLRRIAEEVEFMSIMAFDFHTCDDRYTHHHTALKAHPNDKGALMEYNVESAVQYFINEDVPPEKLLLGIPTYGRTYTLEEDPSNENNTIYKAAHCGIKGPLTRQTGYLSQYEICEESRTSGSEGPWKKYWNENMKSSYAVYDNNGYDNQWISYDTKETIEQKCKLATSLKFGGAMIWSVDSDDFHGNYCDQGPFPIVRLASKACAGR